MENTAKTAEILCEENLSEELAGVLTAISIVSKRLAKKLIALEKQTNPVKEGENDNE